MSNHIWRINKISEKEYHVVEYINGAQSDNPYILAKCTGPAPAGDICIAMHVQQQLKNNQNQLEGLALANFTRSAADLAHAIKRWHCIDYENIMLPLKKEES